MRVLLVTTGSLGDFLPFVGMAKALRARGHDVMLFGGGAFAHFAQEASIPFIPLTSAEADESFFRRSSEGGAAVGSWIRRAVELIEPTYELLAQHCVPGETAMVGLDWMFGARIAKDALKCRLITVHMQPDSFRSKYLHKWWLPPWLGSLIQRALDVLGDWAFAKPVNALRSRLGLAPVARIFRWWNSPDLVIGFFPEWFAAREPDWPEQSLFPGFALYEPHQPCEQNELPEAIRTFLDAGDAPILFGQGSWVSDAQNYFRESITAAQRLGRRAILLTPRRDQLPTILPEGIAHFSFAPHKPLLPRCSAFVHHAGTGSLAAGLAAGIPQLTVPRIGDQHDNAKRLEKLGVSSTIKANRYRADRVAHKIGSLLNSEVVRERCSFYRRRMLGSTFELVADAIERLVDSK